MLKACEYCNCSMEGKHPLAKYCSNSCKCKNHYYNNHEKIKERQRNWWNEKKPSRAAPFKQIFCNWCGEEIIGKRSITKFCSDKCKHANHYVKHSDEMRKKAREWTKNNMATKLAWNANRRGRIFSSTPSYANLDKIAEFYKEAARLTKETSIKHVVDHIIPLQGKFITGFHHENNLQVITSYENCVKSNKYQIT